MAAEKQTVQRAEAALTLALEHAVRMAANGESRMTIANRVYDTEPTLIGILKRPWILKGMVRILERLDRNRPSDRQLPLPISGLVIPPRISTGKGQQHKVPLADATLPQLIAYRKTLKNSRDRKIEQLDQLIAFMRKHVGRSKRITVSQVLQQHKFDFVAMAGAV